MRMHTLHQSELCVFFGQFKGLKQREFSDFYLISSLSNKEVSCLFSLSSHLTRKVTVKLPNFYWGGDA